MYVKITYFINSFIQNIYSKKVKLAWDDLRKAMHISELDSEVNKCMRN